MYKLVKHSSDLANVLYRNGPTNHRRHDKDDILFKYANINPETPAI